MGGGGPRAPHPNTNPWDLSNHKLLPNVTRIIKNVTWPRCSGSRTTNHKPVCCQITNGYELLQMRGSWISGVSGWWWTCYIPSRIREICSQVLASQFAVAKPFVRSSWIVDPLKSFWLLSLREKSKMKELCGWRTCHAIWWGLKLILFTFVNLVSTVKKCPFLLYPNRSGIPTLAKFSILSHRILGVCCLNFLIKSFSILTLKFHKRLP